jgi:ABC-type transport system substrate-binding protein
LAFRHDDLPAGAYCGHLTRTGSVPATVKSYDPNVFLYKTDLGRAKELLTAGRVNKGVTLKYMVLAESEIDKTVAQLHQVNLAQIGINLEISRVDTVTLKDLVFGDAPPDERPAVIGSWV